MAARSATADDLWRGFEARFCASGSPLSGACVAVFAAQGKHCFEFTLNLGGSPGGPSGVYRLRPHIAEFFGTTPDLVGITRDPESAGKFCHVKVNAKLDDLQFGSA